MRVWFNRTYATTAHLIAMLRSNPDRLPVHITATHSDPDSPVLAMADHPAPEPDLDVDAYVGWALRFAAEHRIDVLVPRYRMAELAEARAEFAAQGTALACPDAHTIRLFEDKAAGYAAAARLDIAVPPFAVVGDADSLLNAYDKFEGFGTGVCMKPVVGVGGEGYRKLTHLPATAAEYTGEVRSTVRVDAVAQAWERDGGPAHPVLVMPFLDGAEVSVDVLAGPDGAVLATVGRRHDESRRRRTIVDDPQARATAERLTHMHRISYLSNTQVRYWCGPGDSEARAYLLEVNTRAAGGLFQTALAGVNLAWAAVQLAAGLDTGSLHPRFGSAYVPVNSYVPLRGEPD